MDFSLSTHYAINPLAETKLDEIKDKRLQAMCIRCESKKFKNTIHTQA